MGNYGARQMANVSVFPAMKVARLLKFWGASFFILQRALGSPLEDLHADLLVSKPGGRASWPEEHATMTLSP